jgi:hypothetical protein
MSVPTITPASNQIVNNFTLLNSNITSTVASRSNSTGALTYYLSTSGATTFGNASITTSSIITGTTFVAGNLWVGVGRVTNSIAYSSDGTTWTGLGTSVFGSYGYDIAWNGTLWVAVGRGTNTLAYSSNGTTWTGITGTSIFSKYGSSIAWNGTLWVAVGNETNTIAYSSNGTTWTGLGITIFGSYGLGVAWNGTLWVAGGGGTNTLAYSSNGTTWTGLGKSVFGSYGYGIAWNGTLWVAVGDGTNNLAYSSNGTTWTGITAKTVFSNYGFRVAWNGSLWVAVGNGNTHTFAYSNDGLTWTGLGKTIFADYGQGVAWNGSLWVALGKGTNSIAYSSNGTTWTGITGTSIFGTAGYGISSNAGYAPITSYNGTVSITGPGTINTYVTQAAATGYSAITTPTLAGTINVLLVPTIRPSATQTLSYYSTTITTTVTPTSNSAGTFTYSLDTPSSTIASINTSNGVVTITGSGVINVFVTQESSGNYTAVTTPVAAGTINVLAVPTITSAGTQTIAYRQVNKVTVTPTSTSSGTFTYSLQTNTNTFSGFAVIDPITGIVTLGGIGTINVFVTQAATNVYSAVTTPVPAGTITVNYIAIPCFKEDTQILTIDGYRLIQDLRKGDLIKTLKHGYVPINMIGQQSIYNEKDKMIFDKIFKCTNANYPEIFEDLYITGLHAVLVDELTDEQQTQIKGIYNDSVYITDDKYRLPVCYDERATLYETDNPEKVVIFHLALDHENENLNYGIYANGLLVETTSIRLMAESGLIMVE